MSIEIPYTYLFICNTLLSAFIDLFHLHLKIEI